MILLKAHIVYTTIIHWIDLPVRFNLQFQLSTQVESKLIQDLVQPFLAAIQYHNIIHIPVVVFQAQLLLCPVIKVCQVEISQVLACEIAYRQTFAFTVTVYYLIQQPQHLFICYRVAYDLFQYRVIHVIKILSYVYLKTVTCTTWIRYQSFVHSLHTACSATPLDTGVCVATELCCPVLPQNQDDTVVYDPIWIERCNRDRSLLWIIDLLKPVLSWSVRFISQIPV